MSSSTDRIPVGRLGRPHGVKGELTLVPALGEMDRFEPGTVLLTEDREPRSVIVRSARPYRDRGLIVAFEGVTDRAGAESLRGAVLTVGIDERRDLEDKEYWIEDLIGLEAVDAGGASLGRVVAVNPGPQDRLVVETAAGQLIEIPFVDAIVGDPVAGRLPMDPPSGLFPEPGRSGV